MSKKLETCPECGGTYGIGDYPFCKGTGLHEPSHVKHTWVPYWEVHADTKPFWCDSLATMRKHMKNTGSDFAARGRGMPGQEI